MIVLGNKILYLHAYSYHLVCKRWLGFIRDSAKLSGEMRLILSAINFEISLDIRKYLFQWKKLKTLHVPFVMSAVDLRAYAMLTKVVTSYENPNLLLENLPWIYPSKCFHNPHKKQGMTHFLNYCLQYIHFKIF